MKQEAKKRQALLITLAILLLALVLGLAVYREATKDPIDRIMERMSLRDKLAQMMFFCPRFYREDPNAEKAAVSCGPPLRRHPDVWGEFLGCRTDPAAGDGFS